jgi:AraC-like DNA-binding protein
MEAFEMVSTDGVQQGERSAFWRATLNQKFGLDSRVDRMPDFHAKLECGRWNGVGLFRLSAGGYYVRRTARSAQRKQHIKVAYQIAGTSSFNQNGNCVQLQPGEWTVYDDTQPYVSSNPNQVQLLILTVPMQRIQSRSIDLPRTLGNCFSANRGIAKVAFTSVLNIFDQVENIPQSYAPDLMDIISHQLMLCLIEVQTTTQTSSSTSLLREKTRAYILQNLRNPGLDISKIATELGCSRRYLYKAFEGEPTTIADYIWEMRLSRSREDLRRGQQTITDVAYSWGFSSSAHFSTAFKEHFGLTPSEYRANPSL